MVQCKEKKLEKFLSIYFKAKEGEEIILPIVQAKNYKDDTEIIDATKDLKFTIQENAEIYERNDIDKCGKIFPVSLNTMWHGLSNFPAIDFLLLIIEKLEGKIRKVLHGIQVTFDLTTYLKKKDCYRWFMEPQLCKLQPDTGSSKRDRKEKEFTTKEKLGKAYDYPPIVPAFKEKCKSEGIETKSLFVWMAPAEGSRKKTIDRILVKNSGKSDIFVMFLEDVSKKINYNLISSKAI